MCSLKIYFGIEGLFTQFGYETDVEKSKMAENLHAQIFLSFAMNGKVKLYEFFWIFLDVLGAENISGLVFCATLLVSGIALLVLPL